MSKRAVQSDLFVSVVSTFSGGIPMASFSREAVSILEDHYTNYELILVDNGSIDNSVDQLRAILEKLPCIRIIRLSRRVELETAIFAGLNEAIGDYIISINPGSDPVSSIPKVVARLLEGSDIVYGRNLNYRRTGDLGRKIFFWYSRNFLKINVDPATTYLLGLNRRSLNAITQLRGRYHHLRQMSTLVGFAREPFDYRSGSYSTRRSLATAFAQAIEISITYSQHPLRFISGLGLFAGFLDLLYALYSVLVFIFKKDVTPGWTTLSLQTSVMFFFVFMILVILSEYIGRILEETKQQPSYHIMEELTSNVLIADDKRRNVAR